MMNELKITALSLCIAFGHGCLPEDNGQAAPFFQEKIIRLEDSLAQRDAENIRSSVAVEIAEGFQLDLWASDSLVFDPVALAFDSHGRAYYTSTNRRRNSEIDIRRHREWSIASIGFQHVEDQRAFLKKTLTPENSTQNSSWLRDENRDSIIDWRDLTVLSEEVYRVEDRNGDGIADFAQLFAAGFNNEITDVANGVKPHDGSVFLSVAPDLWRLRDSDGDGVADYRESISHGFGVHIGFGGHNLSGVTVGPDGRIYWGIGDIGMNVTDKTGRQWKYPNQGVIVRANPDGSDFEVYAHGLRNTHEFVFDQYGNIISEDNDGDHPGEMERLVYIVNGSDTGWRINWQFGKYTDPDNNSYKVWMEEGLDRPRFHEQPAYIIPTFKNYRNGPTGMKFNPGTALGEKWRNHFFLVEFVGASARSTINAFTLRPRGAGFEFVEDHQILQGILATGIDFGPDGALYCSDWIEGWEPRNDGRIWKLDLQSTSAAEKAARANTKRLLAMDFRESPENDLEQYLQDADMRVRQKAQFELVKRGPKGSKVLLAALRQKDSQLARIHGIWGLAQLARQDIRYANLLLPFLRDEDPEIIAQTAKMIGDIRYSDIGSQLVPLLAYDYPRVQFFAAEALGRIGHKPAVPAIFDLLIANDDEDVYLRHAGALALARIGEAKAVAALSTHPSRALRIAAVVALRKMQDPGVAKFLKDEDELIVAEAARAINDDWSIDDALPYLAGTLADPRFGNEPLLRRAINANLRLGKEENIKLLADFAGRETAPEEMRAEAVATIGVWARPSVLDRVTGRYRGVIERDPADIRPIAKPLLQSLLSSSAISVKAEAARAIGKLKITELGPALFAAMRNSAEPQLRIAAIEALQLLADPNLTPALELALNDPDQSVRVGGLKVMQLQDLPDQQTIPLYTSLLETGTVEEKQTAVKALGAIDEPAAHNVLEGLLSNLVKDNLNSGIMLELEDAVNNGTSSVLKTALRNYRDGLPANDEVARYAFALEGGNARRGRSIFNGHETAQCTRCHKIQGQGSDVGPTLQGVASRLSRRQLLESLVDPSAEMAPGYGVVTLELRDGSTVVGFLLEENRRQLTVKTNTAGEVRVSKAEIASKSLVPSSMPPMGNLLTREELRDLVAYLGSLK